jgi:hypothetical protein
MEANDWDRAAAYLAPDCVIDWPCSGERLVGLTATSRRRDGKT